MNAALSEIEWTGTGWRCWRVAVRSFGGSPRLRNPWMNSGQTFWWNPGRIETAECFWLKGVSVGWFGQMPKVCGGYVSKRCTCGIRSMATLPALAAFFVSHARLLDRAPEMAAVVGRVRIGGRVQHRIPGLPAREGYQRSEFAQIIGPLYVSPLAERWADGLARSYGPDVVVPADLTPIGGQQEWLDQLATWAELAQASRRAAGIGGVRGRW